MHAVQFVAMLEHVRHGDWHDMHVLLTATLPLGHCDTHVYESKFNVLQDVHFEAKSTHVAQSPLQAVA